MPASTLGSRLRKNAVKGMRGGKVSGVSAMVSSSGPGQPRGVTHSFVDLGDSARVALMLTPEGRGTFDQQAREVLSLMQSVLGKQEQPMVVTSQTVFLGDSRDEAGCKEILASHYGADMPVTNIVFQPPCSGAALALEVWAIGGKSVRVERFGPHALAVSYDSVRWVCCSGIRSAGAAGDVYAQTLDGLGRMREALIRAGSDFEHAVRTWFYLGNITEPGCEKQRYKELNRARTDFYRDIRFCSSLPGTNVPHGIYPASTGIGMAGADLVVGCLTLQTSREDALLLPLENPQQTPAYSYHPKYSPQSPKFSRAMALLLGDYATTWISGTASIVSSETCHPRDLAKQTEQTIDNIERLIAPENFVAHGVSGAGASLRDLAKIRVYLKRPNDFAQCKAICERRFGPVPAIYAVADICRPDLLVEIEGVAFSRRSTASSPPGA